MKKFLPLLLLLGMGSSAYAGGIVSSHTSSVQLTVDAARTDASRIGSSFSISGSNIDTTDGTTAGTVSAGTITSGVHSPGTIAATQDTAGAFSFSQSYTQADAVPQTAPTVGAVGNLADLHMHNSQVTWRVLTSVTVTAGGAGSVAVGQFVNEYHCHRLILWYYEKI